MDLINFVDQIEQLSYIRGEAYTASISIKETNTNGKHLITLLINPPSLLLIFSKNLDSIKTALGFHKAHSKASHGTMVKLIHLDFSFHSNKPLVQTHIYTACFQKQVAEMLELD